MRNVPFIIAFFLLSGNSDKRPVDTRQSYSSRSLTAVAA